MKSQLVLTTLIAFFMLAFTACVSIDINPAQITQADDYDFSEPKSPFDDIKAEEADHAWQSDKTGNTIAIITACNKNADPSLKSFENDTVAAMDETKILKSEKVNVAKTDAVRTLVEGKLEDIPVRVLFYSLKRNNCTYSLTYVSRKESFDKELKLFEDFAQRFEFE